MTGNKIGFASSSFYSPTHPTNPGGGGGTLGIFGWGCATRTLEPHYFKVTWQLTMKLFPILHWSDCQWVPNLLTLFNTNVKKHTFEVSASKPVEFPVLIKAGSGPPCSGLLNKSPPKFWPPSALGCPASSVNWFGLKKNKATVLT